MRNTTKLKHILLLFVVSFDQDEEGNITIILHHKNSGKVWEYTSKSYSSLIAKAYSHLNKTLKESEKTIE